MPLMRLLSISLLSFFLTACGGGGSLEKDGSIGDGDSTTETSTYTLSLKGYLKASDTESNNVTANAPLELRASLVNEDGDALSGERITFALADTIGELNPTSGTALTGSDGVATIELIAGSNIGAGVVTATFTIDSVSYTDTFAFESDGTQSTDPQLNITVINTSGDTSRNVEYSNPLTAQVELIINGEPAAFKLVEFELTGLGTINPTNGTALTNDKGIATISLLAGTEAGAGSVVATYTDNDNTVYSSDGYTFTTEGDAPIQGESLDFSIDLSLTSSTTLTEISTISAADSGVLKATILDGDGIKVKGAVVNFSSTLGNLIPSIGTALTGENGIASLNLTSGTVEGAGVITAKYEGVEQTLGFYTRGDAVNPEQSTADISFSILENCPTTFKTARDPSKCDEVTSISGDSSAIIYIKVTNKNSTTPLTQTLVTATTTIGSISPTTGTAITDANGIALLDIVPGQDVGAGEITVSVLESNLTKAFQIAAVDIEISISSSIADDELLAAGATALVSIEISKDGELYTNPLTVEFSSGCVSSGQAIIDKTVASIGGFARSTYRPLTCVGGDIITATVITGGDTVSANTTINVSPANIGFLQFIKVTEPVIALKGTGGADRTEISDVTFKLVDSNGNDLASRTVDFELSTSVGGITLGTSSAITSASGEVSTSVLSGSVPTPVRVIASSVDEDNPSVIVTAPSDILVVSTGIADQNSFSLSRSIFNPHALNIDGTEVLVNARLADHFNNPVPDGTAVTFITEGGVIEPSCTTTNGACSVTWTSTNPRPFTDSMYENTIAQKCDGGLPCPLGILKNNLTVDLPLGGRATVLAYAIGEETFSDLNGNGYFDSTDFFGDLFDITEAFIDNNEDSTFGGKDCSDGKDLCSRDNSTGDEFEEFVDFDGNGSWTEQNSLYNGLLCREEDETAGLCSRQMVNVFQNQEIVMSGDTAFFRLVAYDDNCATAVGVKASDVHVNSDPNSPLVRRSQSDLASQQMCEVSEIDLTQSATGTGSVSLILYIADIYNNPLPAGTEVSISTDNGELTGETSYVFPNTTSFIPVGVSFGIKREPLTGGNDSPSGSLNISVKAPSGLVSPFSVTVKDDL
ncbi:Ig-like domain-containing protein [Pseudoalteromonas sp. SWYJZ12]|uniref:Ig-like domain-containing protein n=1 Tax=Pseudoalteromonas sp. SWYJZ12 TaxID=2792067 RepID=UPI0018CEE618|nr:Ig-like domain-containing protein [Pseudoalteromonas sp. SWYJZ12]MBH0002239.1 Ig-like domain-containing protein [Pseudoalteromonas sp. SWYJZ12]